jgi:nucleoside-diphosphate-sugar epimerase
MNALITGAHGVVGTAITEHSSIEYDLLDRKEPPATLPDGTKHPHTREEAIISDIGNLSKLSNVFENYDEVVHLAGSPSTDASYESVEKNNVRGTYNTLEAARRADVDTIVFASSNHVVGQYEAEHAPEIYDPDHELLLDHESPVRPDSHYGSSKAAGEAWGRQYAEKYGIQFYAIRIGSVRPPQWDHPYGDAERGVEDGRWERGDPQYERQVARLKCTWQSRRDISHMVTQCLQDTEVEFGIFYGVSDNAGSWFDIEYARDKLKYTPRDSADDDIWDEKFSFPRGT